MEKTENFNIERIKELIADHKKFKLPKDDSFIDFVTWGDSGEDSFYGLNFTKIREEITDRSRWSIFYDVVLEINGRLYMTFYSRGATENQDESPWEYEDNIEFIPAEEYTTISYRCLPNE